MTKVTRMRRTLFKLLKEMRSIIGTVFAIHFKLNDVISYNPVTNCK